MGFPDCSANKEREGSCPREKRWSRERALGDAMRRIMVEGLLLAHCIHSSLPDGETKAERVSGNQWDNPLALQMRLLETQTEEGDLVSD